MTPTEIIEIIMAQHWDISSCHCWICEAGRANGLSVKAENLPHHRPDHLAIVEVAHDPTP